MSDSESIRWESILTCPVCSNRKKEIMPLDSCCYYYTCEACGALLKPNQGDCCVYCRFGSVPCPPVQQGSNS